MTISPKEHSASLASKELQKHYEAVEAAISTHTLEGMSLHPKTLKISKEYAKGDFSHEEFNTLMSHPIL
nr:antitoxin VbhA family protein [Bartonella taylorii]